MLNVIELQRFIPAKLKFALKPYYRTIYPNRLHVILNPTWRCNYECSYCPVVTKFAFTSVVGKSGEKSAAEWLEGLEKLPSAVVYIAGGEPFVYAELAKLVNQMPEKHSLHGIVTNLSLHSNAYRKIEKKIHLNASFHREHIEAAPFVAKIKELSDQFHIHAYIVATPENLPLLDHVADELGACGVSLHVDPYIDPGFRYSQDQMKLLSRHITADRNAKAESSPFDDFSTKRCSAGRNYINLCPDGSAYTCYGGMNFVHSSLYSDVAAGKDLSQFKMGNLFNPDFKLNSEDMICAMPCTAACDRDAAIIKPVAKN
jgi:MoaA/NifB/PqqE/SkfB family radical SAM enzyme